jgi:hypothetical protein
MTEAKTGARRRGRPARVLAAKGTEVTETIEAHVSDRPALRPKMREDDPRAAAARRTAEIMGNLGTLDNGTDEFYIDPSVVPEGWSYEWKRKTLLGQEDPAYQIALARTGWEPVPTKYHPEMMPGNGNHPIIERKGQVLMMRPQEITEQIRQIDSNRAKSQVQVKVEQLSGTPEGGLGHRNHPQAKPKISKSYEAIPVPRD